jgi:hypothetical protein
VRWFEFDNSTGRETALGPESVARSTRAVSPAPLPSAPGAFVLARIACADDRPAWRQPVAVYFRRTGTAWELVGIERSVEANTGVAGHS